MFVNLTKDEWRRVVYALACAEEWHWSSNPKRGEEMKTVRAKVEADTGLSLQTLWD